jgi:hypothetical protein
LKIYGINNRLINASNDGNDANEFTKTAIYYIDPTTAHMPTNSNYSVMINIMIGARNTVQLSIGLSYVALYYRSKLNNVWGDWKTV